MNLLVEVASNAREYNIKQQMSVVPGVASAIPSPSKCLYIVTFETPRL